MQIPTDRSPKRKPLGWCSLESARTLALDIEGHAYRVLQHVGERLLLAELNKTGYLLPLLADPESGVWHQQAAETSTGIAGIAPELLKISELVAEEWAVRIGAAASAGELVFDDDEKENAKKALAAQKDARKLALTNPKPGLLAQLGVCYLDHVGLGIEPHGALTCKVDELNAQPRYIGAPNGVIDLDGGLLLKGLDARPALVTRELPDPFDAEAEHPDVDALFDRIPIATREYLLDELGYSLRGRPNRRIVLEIDATALGGGKGEGNSGKSTRARAVNAALGPYATGLGKGALVQSGKGNAPTPDMKTVMPPARIAAATEIEGARVDAARLKGLSGGDPAVYRDLYETNREGVPSATLWLTGNGLPSGGFGSAGDAALMERLRVIPVPRIPLEETSDRYLDSFNVGEEGSVERRQALVALLVDRALAVAGGKPEPPQEVLDATERVLTLDLGDDGRAIQELVEQREGGRLLSADLFDSLKLADGEGLDSKTAFGMARGNATKRARVVLRLPLAKSVRSVDGSQRRGKGWEGWSLTEEAQAELDAAREGEPRQEEMLR